MMGANLNVSRSLVLVGSSLAVALVAGLVIWNTGSEVRGAQKQAELLVDQLVPDGAVTTAEYAVWQQIAGSDQLTRLELARLLQQEQYIPVLFKSTELVSNSVIGLDYDGAMSRDLVEQLVCKQLEANPLATAEQASLYLVPWLNQAALASEYCARVLTSSLAIAAPDTFLQRAELLAMVLGRLPAEQARIHVAGIVGLMNIIRPADVDVLFSTMQHLDTTAFAGEFESATAILLARITNTQSSADIATLFEAINYLKFDLTPEQLIPILNAALEKMLALRDSNLTYSLYFTLLDLKVSHPDTSFGARADYLMRGLNTFGPNIEISDYAGVLRLDEQYSSSPGYEPAMAVALLADIRNLSDEDYLASIRPYCLRFLELSAALGYEDFMAGATLLTEQLHNEQFIFQRECLHDPRLLARLESAARTDLAAIVVSALVNSGESGASGNATRVAEQVELLDLLGSALNSEQIRQVASVIIELVSTEADTWLRDKLGSAAVESRISFPADFYRELFVMFANSGTLPRAQTPLLEKLPAEQRADLLSTSLHTFFAQTDPAALVTQAEFLVALKPWIPAQDLPRIVSLVTGVVEYTQDIVLFQRLLNVVNNLGPRSYAGLVVRLQPRVMQLISASEPRAELLELFAALRTPRRSADVNAILESAVVRMLKQIEPADGLDRRVRVMMKRSGVTLSPASVEQLSAHFIQVLANANADHLLANYIVAIETLALHARPGELATLLPALRKKLDAVTDTNSHELLLATWAAVETSTNKDVSQEQRIPLYLDMLQLPLNTNDSRALLVGQLEKITGLNFAGDIWQFTDWVQKTSLPNVAPGT